MNRIAIIGHFGGVERFTDGQTVKTVSLYRELISFTNWNIIKVDTYYRLKQPFKLIVQTLYALVSTKNIIILLSANGKKLFFPILYIFATWFKKNIYHDVIGGNLSEDVENYPQYKKYLNAFRVNWVETELLKKELEDLGVDNVAILPNFRCIEPLDEKDLMKNFSEPIIFGTFSRVIKEKGIEDAIHAIQKVNENNGRTVCRLNIYGPIGKEYQEQFNIIMSEADPFIQYCGEVQPNAAVDTLKQFYALLFPTKWSGEGSAGTIIESFFAGVPVIATNWRCNKEMVTTGYNGIIYPEKNIKSLEDAVQWMLDHKSNIYEIKKNCLESAKKYYADRCIKQLIEFMEKTDIKLIEKND